MKFSALNVDFRSPSSVRGSLGSKKPAYADVEKG